MEKGKKQNTFSLKMDYGPSHNPKFKAKHTARCEWHDVEAPY
jgi:hypothetical protein